MYMTAAERCRQTSNGDDAAADAAAALQRYQACVYYADALLCAKGAKRAEAAYMKSLALRKEADLASTSKNADGNFDVGGNFDVAKTSTLKNFDVGKVEKTSKNFDVSNVGGKTLTSESDVKYKLHICLLKQAKFKEALGVLESIPKEKRTPKINVALGQAFKRLNLNKAARLAFKDLLG
uniref:Uncharacterized protein n=1 Tax=Romanomermis culicivorax TaxID=13658 RepID=A0A915JQV6_ROMCU